MFKSRLPFALLLATAWSSTALAFPPCPTQPLEIVPLERASEAVNAPKYWFVTYYALMGNADYIPWIKPWSERDPTETILPNAPKDGKCRPYDVLPVLDAFSSAGSLSVNPYYSPYGGYGVIALPDLRYALEEKLSVRYTLGFDVDNRKLAKNGSWMDIVQLQFAPNANNGQEIDTATLYRVRKSDNKPLQPARLEIIEAWNPAVNSKPDAQPRVVAELTLDPSVSGATHFELRWTQTLNGTYAIEKQLVANRVDSLLEVVGPNGTVLYRSELPEQWADKLTMGLLDYNMDMPVPVGDALLIDNMTLSAIELEWSGVSTIEVNP